MTAAEELSRSVGVSRACKDLGVSRATLYRRRRPKAHAMLIRKRKTPPRALSSQERTRVLEVLHSEPFVDKAPPEVYGTLLDEKVYLCSIRSMYRYLAANDEVRERRNQR